MEDEKIVALYFDRDEQAIAETRDKYEPYLSKIAFNILNDAEDTRESVNDTYLAAWNSMPPHRPQRLSVYLGKLTRRISIDLFRFRTRDKRRASAYAVSLEELGECVSGGASPEGEAEFHRLCDALNRFVRGLSDDARRLFIGRYYFNDTLRDAAAYCGMSESKAKSLLFRTRVSLRDYLTKEGFDP